MAPLPNSVDMETGAAMNPLYGIKPAIVDSEGNELEDAAAGNLIITDGWPGQMRTIYGDHKTIMETYYYTTYHSSYFTGDGAMRDEEGHYWITGRVDDVLNVSDAVLVLPRLKVRWLSHPAAAETAIVGMPHELKGQGICAYIILRHGEEDTERLRSVKPSCVLKLILSPTLTPHLYRETLPKTRSGKIMRRILRKLAAGEFEGLGDTSTLAERCG